MNIPSWCCSQRIFVTAPGHLWFLIIIYSGRLAFMDFLYIPHRQSLNTLRPRQVGCQFLDIFKCIFMNENIWILIEISLKFVPKGPINNIPTLVQIMAWCRPGDKPLSEPMMVSLQTHISVTRPQWINAGHPTVFWGFVPFKVFCGMVPHVNILQKCHMVLVIQRIWF